MRDWLETLDKFSSDFGMGVLQGSLISLTRIRNSTLYASLGNT